MTWSSVDLAQHCVSDRERTHLLLEAVQSIVVPGSTVLEIGAGSGVLSLAALRQGASRVICVEQDPVAAAFLQENAARVNSSAPGRLQIVHSDGRNFQADCAFDVVIAELVDVWLIEEDLYPVLHSLLATGAIGSETIVLPCDYEWVIELGLLTGEPFPFGLRFPFYEWPHYIDDRERWQLPDFEALSLVDLSLRTMREVAGSSEHMSFEVPTEGARAFDAVRLSGRLGVSESSRIGSTSSLNSPIVIPLAERLDSSFGPITVSFTLGGGLSSFDLRCGNSSYVCW